MAKHNTTSSEPIRKLKPAESPEAEEAQLVALATDLAREQLLNKTASSQVITHYLKLGTVKATLENEKLKQENELLKAKTESLQSMQRMEELYADAIKAMRSYSGQSDTGDSDEEYDY